MAALAVGTATIVLALWVAVTEFPRGLLLLACILVAVGAAWYGLLRRGTVRVVQVSLVAASALVGATVLLLTRVLLLVDTLFVAGVLLSLGAASSRLHSARGSAKCSGAAPSGAVFQSALRRG